jgi:hypothetical protein
VGVVEKTFPENPTEAMMEVWSSINKSIQRSFCNSLHNDEKIGSNLLPYFAFLLVYIFPFKKDLIIENFLDYSFKKNLLFVFQLDYLKIRYLGLDFFKGLKRELDLLADFDQKKDFIEKSQIMQIIDLVMIPGLDPYSTNFVNDLKISLIGKTPEIGKNFFGLIEVDLPRMGIRSFEKFMFVNNKTTNVQLSDQNFFNRYPDIYGNLEYAKMAFLGQNEKIIGIAKVFGEKPFYYASTRIIKKNPTNRSFYHVDRKLMEKKFLKSPTALLSLHLNLVGLPKEGKKPSACECIGIFSFI